MNPQDLLKIITGVNTSLALFGRALSEQHQLFVSGNYPHVDKFLQSDEGKIAVQTFVQDWEAFTKFDKH